MTDVYQLLQSAAFYVALTPPPPPLSLIYLHAYILSLG